MIRTLFAPREVSFSQTVGRSLWSTRLRPHVPLGQEGNPRSMGHGEQSCGMRRGMMAKAGKGIKGAKTAREIKPEKQKTGEKDAQVAFLARILDAQPSKMPELSEEEKQRNFEIGKRYNRMMAKEHNAHMADLMMKIKLRDDAIAQLPEILQHAARQMDQTPPPLNRRMATYTPPIPGYDPMDYAKPEDEKLKSMREDEKSS